MRRVASRFARLREFQERGTAILFASHDEGQIRELCGRAIWFVPLTFVLVMTLVVVVVHRVLASSSH